jgi:hypothetical protein
MRTRTRYFQKRLDRAILSDIVRPPPNLSPVVVTRRVNSWPATV